MTLPLNSRLSALYDTNGTQKDFSFGFRVFFDPDNGGYGLEVRRQTADGYEVIPKSDYLVLPVEDNSAGVVRFSVAPSAGQQIYIAGKTPTIQQLVLTNFGRYSAESIETQFDFITAIIQEWLSALGEETRQRIAADEILTQYVVNRIDDFVQQVNQNWDDKSQEIEDYIATIMPSFTQTLRDEIEAFAVAGMQDAIDQTLAESKAEIDDAVARANAAALSAAITGKVYDTPEAGVDPVTGVQNGEYYNVRSPNDESYVDEYQNIGGVPTPSGKSYPSSNAKWDATQVVDGDKNQHEINSYLFKNTYYAEREGISTNNTDNSSAWESLHNRLNHGDVVIFGSGVYKFSRQMEINKIIRLEGKNLSYTQFNFYNQTHGVVRRIRGGELRDIFIRGTQKGTPFNFNAMDPNNVNIGNIGLYDKYNEADSFGSYNTTVNVSIQYFDVGRANITEGSAIWNGAYRETYNIRINNNRCGLVCLNGTTDEKYYGGLISANSEIGIWAYDDNSMYNNIKFIGTTIEGNGTYDQAIGYLDASPSKCNIYVGGNSSVYLIGSYNEKCYNIVENGGQLYKIGSHQHGNAIDTTKGGYVYYSGINWGDYYKVPYYNRLSSFIYGFSGATVKPITNSKGIRITSNVDQSSAGYSVRSRLINLPSGITSDNIKGLKFRLKYKINSGFTQNSGLRVVIQPYLYAKDGSYTAIREGVWSKYQTKSGNGIVADISTAVPVAVVDTPTTWNLNKGSELSHILLTFSWKKEDGTNPNFATDNLDMELYDIEIGIFARDGLNLTEYRNNRSTTAERPVLTVDDKGYEYFDTTLQKPFLWDGDKWVEELTSSYAPVSAASDTASLQSVASTINTTGKLRGKFVYNQTNGKMYFALASTATSAWRPTDNSGDITPI